MSIRLLFLIEESQAMESKIHAGSTKIGGAADRTKRESVANAVNGFLNRIHNNRAPAELAIFGYSTTVDGKCLVTSRLFPESGPHGCVVSAENLGNSIKRTESRQRKNLVGNVEETIDFPIFYEMETGDKSPQVAAFTFLKELLESSGDENEWIVIHVFVSGSADGNPVRIINSIQRLPNKPLLFHVHIGSNQSIPPVVFPSTQAMLASATARDLFNRSDNIPEKLQLSLRETGIQFGPSPKSFIYNARMLDFAQLLKSIEGYVLANNRTEVMSDPQAATTRTHTSPTTDNRAIVEPDVADDVSDDLSSAQGDNVQVADIDEFLWIGVVDCSVEDPFNCPLDNPVAKHGKNLGLFLEQLAKFGSGNTSFALITYGAGDDQSVSVSSALDAAPGQTVIPCAEIPAIAIRVEQFKEELSNGAGGILTISHELPVLRELEPAGYASPRDAFIEAARIGSGWQESKSSNTLVILVHFTRGEFANGDLREACNEFRTLGGKWPEVIYHWISNNSLPTIKYPTAESVSDSPELVEIVSETSRIIFGAEVAKDKPQLSSQSIGLVCNDRFDLLTDPIRRKNRTPVVS